MPAQGYGNGPVDLAITAAKSNDKRRDSENESQEKSSIVNSTPQECGMFRHPGDDAQKQTFSESLLLLGNLEYLLAQWTTLDKHEIQRGEEVTF